MDFGRTKTEGVDTGVGGLEVPVNGKPPLRMRRETEVRRSRRCQSRSVGRSDGWDEMMSRISVT